jgi:hypothetical protein
MGQVGSTGEFTQEGIKEIKDVKDTDAMMNLILRYMIKQIGLNDFMKLSQPDTCQLYVISLAQHMSTQFSRLQIMPYREKKSDTLLFKKYSELNPSTSTTDHPLVEKKNLCLLLSYYYVRIFQIYGALALTLLNDISLSEKAIKTSDTPRRVNQTPGSEMTRVANIKQYGGFHGGLHRGGVATKSQINDSLFKCVSSYLVNQEQPDQTKGWIMVFQHTTPNGARVYFDKTGQTKTSAGVITDSGKFTIYPPATNNRYFTLEVSATPIEKTSQDVTLKYGTLKAFDSSTKITLPPSFKPVSIKWNGTSYEVHTPIKDAVTITDISNYFNGLFDELMPLLLSKKKSETSDTLEDVDETDTDEAIKVTYMKQGLESRKTVGHCIARALQLLRTMPSAAGTLYQSDICMEKFTFSSRSYKGVYTSSDGLTRGIPEYGKSLAQKSDAGSKGFRSLVQLFYDTVAVGSPHIFMGDTAFLEYQKFIKKMADLFRDDTPQATPTMKLDKGVAEIKNKRDKELCETELKKSGAPISINATTAKEVSKIVQELYRIQVNHAVECGKIFRSLFEITYDARNNPLTISLSKRVLTNGFEEIDRINAHARAVLVEYYTKCEHKYVQGVNIIMEPIRRERQVKLSADATRAEQASRALPLQRTMSNQTVPRYPALAPALAPAPAPALKPLLTFPTRPAAPAPAAPAAAPAAAAPRPLLTFPTRPVASAPAAAPVARPPLMRAHSTQNRVKTGGTRKRHVIRQ